MKKKRTKSIDHPSGITDQMRADAASKVQDFQDFCSLKILNIKDISKNGNIRRGELDADKVHELAESIASVGLQQPITVCQQADDGEKFILILGHRRLAACSMLGLPTIQALVHPPMNSEVIAVWQAVENIQRDDLKPLEQADAAAAAMRMHGDPVAAAAELGVTRKWIESRMELFGLCDEVVAKLEDGTLSMAHAQAFAKTPDHDEQRRVLGRILPNEYRPRVSPADKVIQQIYFKGAELRKAKWLLSEAFTDDDNATLPACNGCPSNSLNSPELFHEGDDAPDGQCLNSTCYKAKMSRTTRAIKAVAGVVVRDGLTAKEIPHALKNDGYTFVPVDAIVEAAKALRQKKAGKSTPGDEAVKESAAKREQQDRLQREHEANLRERNDIVANAIMKKLKAMKAPALACAMLEYAERCFERVDWNVTKPDRLAKAILSAIVPPAKWSTKALEQAVFDLAMLDFSEIKYEFPSYTHPLLRENVAALILGDEVPPMPAPPEGLELAKPASTRRRVVKAGRKAATTPRTRTKASRRRVAAKKSSTKKGRRS